MSWDERSAGPRKRFDPRALACHTIGATFVTTTMAFRPCRTGHSRLRIEQCVQRLNETRPPMNRYGSFRLRAPRPK
jgi:hypothetical protein